MKTLRMMLTAAVYGTMLAFVVVAGGKLMGLEKTITSDLQDLHDLRVLCESMRYDLSQVQEHELHNRTRLDIIISGMYRTGGFRATMRTIEHQDSVWRNGGGDPVWIMYQADDAAGERP